MLKHRRHDVGECGAEHRARQGRPLEKVMFMLALLKVSPTEWVIAVLPVLFSLKRATAGTPQSPAQSGRLLRAPLLSTAFR